MYSVDTTNSRLEKAPQLSQGTTEKSQQASLIVSQAANGNKVQSSGQALQPIEPVAKPENSEAVKASIDSINQFISEYQRTVKFSIDGDTNQTVIKVINTATDEVIRQMPSEEVIALAKIIENLASEYNASMMLSEQGLLFTQQA